MLQSFMVVGPLMDLKSVDGKDKYVESTNWSCIPYGRYSTEINELWSSQCCRCCVGVARLGDLLSMIYLEVSSEETDIDVIDYVDLRVDGESLERIEFAWLKVMASYDQQARPVRDGKKVIYPIKFAVFGSDGFFPLVALPSSAQVQFVCAFNLQLKTCPSMSIFAKYHILNDSECRRSICKEVAYPVWNKISENFTVDSDGSSVSQLRLTKFHGPVRELFVYVHQHEKSKEPMREPVKRMRMMIDGVQRTNMSPGWHRLVEARNYNATPGDDLIYYIPFDNTPLAVQPACTLNMGMFDNPRLDMSMCAGKYTVVVCARVFNILCMTPELNGLKWSASQHDDQCPGFPVYV